jgi:hypothetical protein
MANKSEAGALGAPQAVRTRLVRRPITPVYSAAQYEAIYDLTIAPTVIARAS